MEHSTLPVIDKNSEIEMGSLGERAMEEGGKEGSVRASAGPGGLELDSKGRRPIILGGREEKIVLASLFFTMCEFNSVYRTRKITSRAEFG